MNKTQLKPISRDWISKTIAGLFLGFLLALNCSRAFFVLNTGIAVSAKTQLAMWIVVPVWLAVLSGVYFFQSGRQAWSWLMSVNAVLYLTQVSTYFL